MSSASSSSASGGASDSASSSSAPPLQKFKKRAKPVKKACLRCSTSHHACSDERPCKRCKSKGIECVEKPERPDKYKRINNNYQFTNNNNSIPQDLLNYVNTNFQTSAVSDRTATIAALPPSIPQQQQTPLSIVQCDASVSEQILQLIANTAPSLLQHILPPATNSYSSSSSAAVAASLSPLPSTLASLPPSISSSSSSMLQLPPSLPTLMPIPPPTPAIYQGTNVTAATVQSPVTFSPTPSFSLSPSLLFEDINSIIATDFSNSNTAIPIESSSSINNNSGSEFNDSLPLSPSFEVTTPLHETKVTEDCNATTTTTASPLPVTPPITLSSIATSIVEMSRGEMSVWDRKYLTLLFANKHFLSYNKVTQEDIHRFHFLDHVRPQSPFPLVRMVDLLVSTVIMSSESGKEPIIKKFWHKVFTRHGDDKKMLIINLLIEKDKFFFETTRYGVCKTKGGEPAELWVDEKEEYFDEYQINDLEVQRHPSRDDERTHLSRILKMITYVEGFKVSAVTAS